MTQIVLSTSKCVGTVKFFNPSRGTGLVRPDDGSDDIYINTKGDYDRRSYDRGAKVRFNLHRQNGRISHVTNLRPA